MAEIKAAEVKALREATGAGMMECKKALVECNGDAEAAAKLLKEKGLAAVAKRAERATKEGRVFVKQEGGKAVMAELTCETDFVAKNEKFIALGEAICAEALAKGYTEVNEALSNMMLDLATEIRENMSVRRLVAIDVPADCVFAKYIHSDGKTGVMTLIETDGAVDNADVKAFAYDCCLHVAAFTPAFVRREDVSEAYINEQKEVFLAQMNNDEKVASKPENVKQGILNGKINKHLADICFLDQPFVKDDKVSVAKKMEEVGKTAGCKLNLKSVTTFILGA